MQFIHSIYLNIINSRVNSSISSVKDLKTESYNYKRQNSITNLVYQNNSKKNIKLNDLKNLLFIAYNFIVEELYRTKNLFFNSNLNWLYAFIFILFIDACLTDDEPLWDPVEWSLVQAWILFLFSFSWIIENLLSSRYGSYVGRDKRVWLGWFKTHWFIEGFYALNYGAASVFVITPFYNETRSSLFFVYSWWNWFSRVFMFKFMFIFCALLVIGYFLQRNSRWMNWKKGLILTLVISSVIAYLLFTQFIILMFGYLTNSYWYNNKSPIDYVQMSHAPLKWQWGDKNRDHFYQHPSRTVFWFKNDGPFAASFVMFHFFFVFSLFQLFIYWFSLFRRISATKEVPLTFTTYCVAALRHFLYMFMFFYIMIFMSFSYNYFRLPFEYSFYLENTSWISNFMDIVFEYPLFLLSILL